MGLSKPQTIGLVVLGIGLLGSFISKSPPAQNPLLTRNNNIDRSNAPDAQVFIISSEDQSKEAIKEINKYRKENGLTPINYSSKVYQLAVLKAKDMNQYNYFQQVNPETGFCSEKAKLNYGIDADEFLLEAIYRYIPQGANMGAETKTLSNATHEWIDYDRGRKDSNFLFNYHLAGAVGCDGNKCVFLALNKSGYRSNCLK